MDPTGTTNPILRIQPLTAYQGSGRQQQLPFNQGQLLQGLVSAKSGANQFTIEIGGRQIQAESTAQLQVGQKLDLQVAALAPQVELQIVRSNPVNRLIGNAIHLLGQQTATFPVLSDLAQTSEPLPQLSPNSKNTLQFYAANIADRAPATPPAPQNQLTVQLLSRAFEILAAQPNANTGSTYAAIGDLLQQLSQTATLAPTVAQQAGDLAPLFAQIASQQPSGGAQVLPATAANILTTTGTGAELLAQANIAANGDQRIQNLLTQILPLLEEANTGPTYAAIGDLLQQLSQTATLAPTVAQQAGDLAPLFAQITSQQPSGGANGDQRIQNLLTQLLPLLEENSSLPVDHPLRQLVALLVTTENETMPSQPVQLDGSKLREVTGRLGMNMEQLLANNNREQAVQTLKYALLELSQQVPVNDNSHDQAEQIVKSIELYQLLQIRLASESLFFLPLPFSFLDQGYLLVNADHPQNASEENPGAAEQSAQRFELHLQLEGLGNLQIDLHQSEGGITLKFLAEDIERAKFLAGFRTELGQWLTAVDLESAQFLVGAKEPAKTLLEKIIHGATGMVDTQA